MTSPNNPSKQGGNTAAFGSVPPPRPSSPRTPGGGSKGAAEGPSATSAATPLQVQRLEGDVKRLQAELDRKARQVWKEKYVPL